MDPKKLDHRNAAKLFEDDDPSSSSSSSSSNGSSYTRAMEFYDRASYRIEGAEGEFDRICGSLGLSGPENFTIPAEAWEAIKLRSSFDILPRPKEKEAETSRCCTGGGGGAIKGFRPPMLKLPRGSYTELSASDDDDQEEEEEVGGVRLKREKEENAAMIEEFVGGFSGFTTSNEDDSPSTITDPPSSNPSPIERIKHVITAGNWEKGELLGRGSFGSVYEGISV
ncbi:Mitogen-activated protein kinase kinase kinase 1 [Spatholobus suberectus]|nr:Mitogen-activated protein kinase kinase kinase 1 [Spatholobus suberectus]